MRLVDALTEKGQPFRIPDADRNDLPQLYKDLGFTTGVEIGTDKGKYAKIMCEAGLKLYCVDPWLWYDDYPHPEGQKRLDHLYDHSKRLLEPLGATIIRKTSMEAVKDFKPGSIDFVYIDGHHGFKYVAEDLWEWSKVVRKGGIIAGHDFALTIHTEIRDPFVLHVKHVLLGYTKALHIDNWYVIGSDNAKPGEKREMFRSWFWINK